VRLNYLGQGLFDEFNAVQKGERPKLQLPHILSASGHYLQVQLAQLSVEEAARVIVFKAVASDKLYNCEICVP
jgi:hypothetical protein